MVPHGVRGRIFSGARRKSLIRGFYLPLPKRYARSTDGQSLSATRRSQYLNVESRPHESVFVDGESDVLRLTYENTLWQSVRYRSPCRFIHDSGGFLDSAIDRWHRWFGLNPGNRPFYPRMKSCTPIPGRAMSISHSPKPVSATCPATSAGTPSMMRTARVILGWPCRHPPVRVQADRGWCVGWRRVGAWRPRWPKWQLAAELGLAQPFGDEIFAGHAHKTSVFARSAATRAHRVPVVLRAQLDGQAAASQTATSDCWGEPGSDIGAVRRLGDRWRLEFGFAETLRSHRPRHYFLSWDSRQSGAK